MRIFKYIFLIKNYATMTRKLCAYLSNMPLPLNPTVLYTFNFQKNLSFYYDNKQQ